LFGELSHEHGTYWGQVLRQGGGMVHTYQG
jgi:hypothetical protein